MSNPEFYEAFANRYEQYYGMVDPDEAIRQWLMLLEEKEYVSPWEERLKLAPTLLDLGCGPGWHLEPWWRAGFSVSGMDSSPSMLRLAAKRSPRTPLYCADITDTGTLVSLKQRFSVIVAHFNFLNLFTPSQLSHVFHSISKLLCPGGIFVTDYMSQIIENCGTDEMHLEIEPVRRELNLVDRQILVQWNIEKKEWIESYWLQEPPVLENLALDMGLKAAKYFNWNSSERTTPFREGPDAPRLVAIFFAP